MDNMAIKIHAFTYALILIWMIGRFGYNVCAQTCLQKCENCEFSQSNCEDKDGSSESQCIDKLSTVYMVAYDPYKSDKCYWKTCNNPNDLVVNYDSSSATYRYVTCLSNGCTDVTLTRHQYMRVGGAETIDYTISNLEYYDCITYCVNKTFAGTPATCSWNGDKDCRIYTSCTNGICAETSDGSSYYVYIVTCDATLTVCGNPNSPANGNVAYSSVSVGSVATFSCNIGYNLNGQVTRTCDSGGSWNGTQPTCDVVDCGQPLTITNGNFTVTSTQYLGTVTYSCHVGYTLNGLTSQTCDSSGVWIGTQPTCDIVNCGQPSTITNGNFTLTSTNYQGIVTYSCNVGYNLTGMSTQTCDSSGSWAGTKPTCVIVDCGQPSTITNGNFTVTSTNYQGIVTYSCNVGYNLTGMSTQTCDSSGSWAGTKPTCVIVDCGQPLTITNGNFTVTSTNYQGIVTHSCNDGYTLNGTSSQTCDSTGVWNGSQPMCDIVDCGQPSTITNGNFTLTSTQYLGIVTYVCNDGYTLNGTSSQTCDSTGVWNGSQPMCEIVDCGQPAFITDGNITVTSTQYQGIVTYSCSVGYTLIGLSSQTCDASGSWNGTQPICVQNIVDCGQPQNITNGNFSVTSTQYLGTVIYSCNDGYILNGTSSSQTCDSTGVWNGSQPICDIVDCGQPSSLVNGNFTVTSTQYLGFVTYVCNDGYTLNGSSSQTCDSTGVWNGSQPICDIVDCGQPSVITNGNFTLTSTQYLGTVTYSCNDGYILNGTSSQTCDSTGVWNGSQPSCDPMNCITPPSLPNGNAIWNDTTFQHSVIYSCDVGFFLIGDATRTCQQNGSWTEPGPICVVDCGIPADITNGAVSYNSTYEGSVANYICLNSCTISGNIQTTCQASGSWSHTTPTCTCPECPPLSNPSNGEVITSNSNTIGSVASYTCNQGYLISGQQTRTCDTTMTWTSSEPTCDFVKALYIASCLCNENREFVDMTEEEIITKLIQDTMIDTEKTALAEQKFKCAEDKRTSSSIIGTSGIAIIALILGVIVLLDCLTLFGRKCRRRQGKVQSS